MAEHQVDKQKATFHLKIMEVIADALDHDAIKPEYAAKRLKAEILESHQTLTGAEHEPAGT